MPGMKINKVEPMNRDECKIGDLEYGTIFRYSGASGSVYIKVNKKDLGSGLSVCWSKGYCVALNLKLGTLRELKGSVIVSVQDAELEVSPTTAMAYHKKDWCCGN